MALHDPDAGYYARREPIGAQGDFITAPEISQVFGELIGLWCARMWRQLGKPDPVILAELGPGRGVLIKDLLRAAATVPEFQPRAAPPPGRSERRCFARCRKSTSLNSGLSGYRGSRTCRTARCCSSPTSSSTHCQFGSSCAAARTGRSEWWRSTTRIVSSSSMGPRARLRLCWFRRNCATAPGRGAIIEICPAALALAAALGTRLGATAGGSAVRRLRLFYERAGPDTPALCSGITRSRCSPPREPPISAPMSISPRSPRPRAPAAPTLTDPCRKVGFWRRLESSSGSLR